jgi:hypothetical protein
MNTIAGSQVDRAQEVHPNKCDTDVRGGLGGKDRRIFSLMDYFASCYKSAQLNSFIIGHLQNSPSLVAVFSPFHSCCFLLWVLRKAANSHLERLHPSALLIA